MFISPDIEHGFMGYTEPLRRFVQPEGYTPQVNELKKGNRCPVILTYLKLRVLRRKV
jgi:hypothetical protein